MLNRYNADILKKKERKKKKGVEIVCNHIN